MLRGPATISFFADSGEVAHVAGEVLELEPYFERKGPDGSVVYAEFRIGDHQTELGIIDSRFRPSASGESGGAIVYWHVDDLDGAVARLRESGAREYEPITVRGEGFVTASVVDPFGNVLGVMRNEHYREIADACRAGQAGVA